MGENCNPMVWSNHSKKANKQIGVKQRRPLSPKLFTEVKDEVIATIIEVTEIYDKETTEFKLPIVLVYTDDIVIIIEDETALEIFLDKMKMLLPSTGPIVFSSKSTILISDDHFNKLKKMKKCTTILEAAHQ